MAARLGRVEQIWRYPVKSLGGERLARAQATEDGLAGDRCWTLWDETRNKIASGKQHPRIMLQRFFADPDKPCGPVCVVDLDGTIFRSDDPRGVGMAFVPCRHIAQFHASTRFKHRCGLPAVPRSSPCASWDRGPESVREFRVDGVFTRHGPPMLCT